MVLVYGYSESNFRNLRSIPGGGRFSSATASGEVWRQERRLHPLSLCRWKLFRNVGANENGSVPMLAQMFLKSRLPVECDYVVMMGWQKSVW